MTAKTVGMLLVTYLIGSVPAAVIVGWFAGVDPRTVGSRNPGAANVFREIGKGWGIFVGCFDVLKGFLVVSLARWALGLGLWEVSAVALTAIIGHNWPIYLRFRGGKGIATAIGTTAAISPGSFGIAMTVGVLVGFAMWAVPTFAGYKIPGGTTAGLLALFIWALFYGERAFLLYAVGAPGLLLIRGIPRIKAFLGGERR